jgi:hypothetical protein
MMEKRGASSPKEVTRDGCRVTIMGRSISPRPSPQSGEGEGGGEMSVFFGELPIGCFELGRTRR